MSQWTGREIWSAPSEPNLFSPKQPGMVGHRWADCTVHCERLPRSQNPIVQEYRLPDFTPANPRGYIMSGPNAVPQADIEEDEVKVTGGDEDVVNMGNERFSVPELVFNPRDIGKRVVPMSGRLI